MERIIFILSYEKRWDCWMVYANRAIDAGDFFQSIGRYIGDEDLEVWPVVRKITETIRKYDTPMLFKQFGRKKFKDERMFLQKWRKRISVKISGLISISMSHRYWMN